MFYIRSTRLYKEFDGAMKEVDKAKELLDGTGKVLVVAIFCFGILIASTKSFFYYGEKFCLYAIAIGLTPLGWLGLNSNGINEPREYLEMTHTILKEIDTEKRHHSEY